MASSGRNTERNSNTKRRKIEMKEVEQLNKRHVTFSKRKLGLFNKLTELSLLCQVETAMIVTSQNGKLYTCGYPDTDVVIHRYLVGGLPPHRNEARKKKQQELVESLRLEYEAVHNRLKEEKERLQAITIETQKSNFYFSSWWNLSTNHMDLENLEQFKTSLEHLKFNLVGAVQEKQLNSMPLAIVPPMPSMSLMLIA
ncbi:Agamous-like MADS-box protein AGL62, partial [Mucuna pruriens]